MNETDTVGVLVVGVQPGQVEDVVGVAAQLAAQLKARLVCVWVDPSLVSGGFRRDGSEIIEPINSSDEWIRQRTGVITRVRANEDTSALDLAVDASREAIERSGIDPSRIGAVIVATSGNHDSPARLGAGAAFASAGGLHLMTKVGSVATPVVGT